MSRLISFMKSDIVLYMVFSNNNGFMSFYGDYFRGNNSRSGSGDNFMVFM